MTGVQTCALPISASGDTATTEIYTTEHTLSLHDALPIPSKSTSRYAMHSLSPGNASLEPNRSCIIELELREMSQLFNSMDPSPLENKDLNDDVEEFIVSSSEEYRPDQALTLRIYLEDTGGRLRRV